jgi:siroheme synthase
MPTEASDPPPRPLSRRRKAALVGEIVAQYARARWLLSHHELPRAVELLRSGARRGANRPETHDTAQAALCASAVERVLRLLPADSRCLVRSLVLIALLERRGIEALVVIGVLAEPSFAAHAWVEHRGAPLLRPGAAGRGRLVEL